MTEDDKDLPEAQDDETFTVNQASAQLLNEIVCVLKDKAWQVCNDFFMSNIVSQTWTDQYAGLVALESLIPSCTKQLVIQNLSVNVGPLIALMARPEAKIRAVTASIL